MEGRAWQFALMIGAVFLAALMMAHPAGGHSGYGAGDDAMLMLSYVVHGGAIAATILITFGLVGLSARLGFQRPLVVLALVVFFFAAIAVMFAATLNGFVAPKFMAALAAGKMTMGDVKIIASYNWWFNQALSNLYLVAASIAILLFSLAWPSRKVLHLALRGIGIAASLALPLAFLFGPFKMDLQGVVIASLADGVWFVGAAFLGSGVPRNTTPAP